MIHHVKQKLRLNLNANAVDAIVHFNVKATAERAGRLAELALSQDTPARWGQSRLSLPESFLPGSLFTPASAIFHPGRVLSLPGCFFPLQVSLSARHLPPIITSTRGRGASTGPLLSFSGCSRSPSTQYDCVSSMIVWAESEQSAVGWLRLATTPRHHIGSSCLSGSLHFRGNAQTASDWL